VESRVHEFLVYGAFLMGLLVVYMLYRPKRAPAKLKLRENQEAGNSRDLSVIFQFNGHSFEAHEVLGCPAGCDLPVAESAFKKALSHGEAASHEFLTLAYEAIRSRHSQRAP
jgi:hypothetical protein